MLTQVPLPLLPGDAAEIAPGVSMVTGLDGSGVMLCRSNTRLSG